MRAADCCLEVLDFWMHNAIHLGEVRIESVRELTKECSDLSLSASSCGVCPARLAPVSDYALRPLEFGCGALEFETIGVRLLQIGGSC